ncbi:uncharacterized protein BDW47DRAFT_110334 [Aspergillus candidus]|uniref:Uncharacterized protein n=1 Tax=Aspergillus candidus TaxID=41067 RepID=A0A2I2F458_ASPCN|nr:hypothetical protein BDW47DRAFT_110334 [Aspergillus candidus]PLB35432.1 hypothetical protein BDW47DRAFT_110334 [Aspergillus candidus]
MSFFSSCRGRSLMAPSSIKFSRPTLAVHILTSCATLCLCLGSFQLTIAFPMRRR